MDIQGNPIGCDIGRTIRDELAMEALTMAIKGIPADFDRMIRNLTGIISAAISASGAPSDDPQLLQMQLRQISRKKEAVIDAFASGAITREELEHMKAVYDEKITALNGRLRVCTQEATPAGEQLRAELHQTIRAIVTCELAAAPLYKTLLDKMTVQKDGTLQLRLRHIPQVWHFELQYHKTRPK